MKYIRTFKTVADFEAAKASLALPNIGLIVETGKTYAISGKPKVYEPLAFTANEIDMILGMFSY